MIQEAAEIVKNLLSELSFIDKKVGLVKTYEVKDSKGNTGRYPIAWNMEESECNKGRYVDLVPNSKSKGAIYFEGDRMNISRTGNYIEFNGDLKLICWLNLKKVSPETSFTPYAIAQIIQAIPTRMFSYSGNGDGNYQYQRVAIIPSNTEHDGIFSKYTYGKSVMLYPFDSFAINLNVSFRLNNSCFVLADQDEEVCSTNSGQFDKSFSFSFR